MSTIIAIIILGVVQVTGIGIVVYFSYKTVKVQQEMILNLAMFKKSSDPFQIRAMKEAIKSTDEQEKAEIQLDPNDGPSVPDNLSDDAMQNLRNQI